MEKMWCWVGESREREREREREGGEYRLAVFH